MSSANASTGAAENPDLFDTQPEMRLCQPMRVEAFGLTDRGKVKETNEDQFLIAALVKSLRVLQTSMPQTKVDHDGVRSHLFVVADGMGGHLGGEVASALAVASVESFVLESFKWFANCKSGEQDEVLTDFQKALARANAEVQTEALAQPELAGMGTTMTLAYCIDDELFVAHVGDSRCYLHRNDVLVRLTRDHTIVEEMVRRGRLTPAEAAKHRLRHVVTNVIGGNNSDVHVEIHRIRLEDGDRMLLCSDGLSEMLSNDEIDRILEQNPGGESACRSLVDRANEKGGRDNVTAVVAKFSSDRR